MDYAWTPPSPSAPKILYRVVTNNQHTRQCMYGLTSGLRWMKKSPDYTYTSRAQLLTFLHTIRDHRQQKREPSQYISFFADKREAMAWYLAVQDLLGQGRALIMEVNAKDLTKLKVIWFQISDVVKGSKKLNVKNPEMELGLAVGQTTGEVLVCGYVPWEAVVGGKERWMPKLDIRDKLQVKTRPFSIRMASMLAPPTRPPVSNSKKLFVAPKFANTCIWNPCGCAHIEVCKHFNWDICRLRDVQWRYNERNRKVREQWNLKARKAREEKRKMLRLLHNQKSEKLRVAWSASGNPRMDDLQQLALRS